jgi:alpha-tubulin suppressor-like RCC1 family protein
MRVIAPIIPALIVLGGLPVGPVGFAGPVVRQVTGRTTAPNVAGETVAAITTGLHHACALTSAGTVKCWGSNYRGQLGDGGTTERLTPGPVAGLGGGVTAISASDSGTCARTVRGRVLCWGMREAGDPRTPDDDLWLTVPTPIVGLRAGITSITGNNCVLNSEDAVRCLGYTEAGIMRPRPVVGLRSGVASISGGANHTCVVRTDGAARCWGDNGAGQVGRPTRDFWDVPAPVVGLRAGVAAISVGAEHTCAIVDRGAVTCWGWNGTGQLGDGGFRSRYTPQPVVGMTSEVRAISAGYTHTCAVSEPGAVSCWGENHNGGLGDGSTTNRAEPARTVGLRDGVSDVRAGLGFSCARTEAEVYCWGENAQGQLGDGSTTARLTPVPVVGFGG